ncbi:MAG: hypothetical protein BRD50_03425 [Bacteroidetes bacterium SW_11_45_7]|nr:MAG: hypothetical protein BRD50_03425 [Bacteroidetes bacterium SW_11_45_7]
MIDVSEDIHQRVERSLNTMRPYLEADGGDIEIAEITDDLKVRLRLLGACKNCPQSYMTMSAGVEEAIKNAVPEIQEVEAIHNDE